MKRHLYQVCVLCQCDIDCIGGLGIVHVLGDLGLLAWLDSFEVVIKYQRDLSICCHPQHIPFTIIKHLHVMVDDPHGW